MITRFDHIIIAAQDLDRAIQLYKERLGLDARYGGRHTGRGTHNALIRFGLDYLEILAVTDAEELQAAPAKRVRLLDYLAKREGGLLAYCLATDDIDALAEQFQRTGLTAIGPFDMERTRPDGVTLKWRLLIPGGSAYRQPWPFFIQWELDDEERLTYETPGNHPFGVTNVAGVAVAVNELEQARHLYSKQLGLTAAVEDILPELGAARLRYELGNFRIDLLAPTGDGPVRDELDDVGEGVYAVIVNVDSLEQSRSLLENQGLQLTDVSGHGDLLMPSPEQIQGTRLWCREVK